MAACEFSRSGMAGKLLSFESQLDKPDTTICNLAHEFSQAFSHGRNETQADELWTKMKEEAKKDVEEEPLLGSYYVSAILAHDTLESALATHLGYRLGTPSLPGPNLAQVFQAVFSEDRAIGAEVREDLKAIKERDPACVSYVQIMLNFKGFLAIQAHRVAHRLWLMGRVPLALVIQNRVSEAFAVDIHPGARVGKGVLLDHATGTVIGETAIIGDNVSILHNVTLGGTGKVVGDRHPKIGDGVLVGAGTHVLGNVRVGAGAKIGAGSVVLKEVPESTTAVGNPARLLGGRENPVKLTKVPSFTMDQTYEWSDYVI
ncbi:serine acetyltransferase 1, chloroplastic-like [Nymphaea colorata]|uniref:serine acetyltransferase 1, chloroplastic-like n=1 Tax=Nymphaea colorata TaxID=210225 RepID=UPI00129ED359|nr:serine acetyltransferase 1, chloroplastic-like [Nymphaea colorata]